MDQKVLLSSRDGTESHPLQGLPAGEQPVVVTPASADSVVADILAGQVHFERNNSALITAYGETPFFIDLVKVTGRFDDARRLVVPPVEIVTQKVWSAAVFVYDELARDWRTREDIASNLDAVATER